LWRLDLTQVPIFFTGYINASTGSIFPLAPWSAFLLSGILTAHLLWDGDTKRVRPNAHVVLFALGACTLFVGYQLAHAGLGWVWGEHNYWKTSPFFFLVRIGVIWLLLALLTVASRPKSSDSAEPETGKRTKAIQTLGQETLVIYV